MSNCVPLQPSIVRELRDGVNYASKYGIMHDFDKLKNPQLLLSELLSRTVSSPVTGLEWPRVFQEVKVPRFHDSGTGWW